MPGKFKYTYLPIIITYLLLTVGMSFSYGQKKKSKESNQQRNAKLSPIKEGDKMQAEYLFTEGVKNAIIEDYPKAISYIRNSLEHDPSNAAAYYKLAEVLFKTGKVGEAEKSIQLALEKEKTNKYYYILAADIQAQQGKFQEAATLYEKMLEKTDAGPQHNLELAVLYLHLRDFNKAIKAFDNAEKMLGANEQIILQKQKLYLEQNKLQEALKEGEKLVKNFPDEPAYVIRQAELLINNQRLNEAKAYLQNYIQEHPEQQPHAQYLLGKIYQQQGNFKSAEESLRNSFNSTELSLEVKVQEIKALIEQLPNKEIHSFLEKLTNEIVSTHPDEFQAHVAKGDFHLAINEKQKARDSYTKALELDQSSFAVWQNALSLGIDLGRYDSVAKEAEQALELFPNQASIYYFSGAANLSLKSYDEAVFAFEQGKKLAGPNQELLGIFNSHLGDAYHGMEEFSKSDAAYEAALRATPDNDYILNNYSYYLSLRQEKLNMAREMSEKLIRKHPNNPTYLDTHAWVLYQLKQYTEAKQLLEKAIANKGNEDGTIVEHYGDVLFKLNQKEEAVQQWKKAKELPNASDLLEKKINDKKLYE